jgi:undecaprenyl-diphosphatase
VAGAAAGGGGAQISDRDDGLDPDSHSEEGDGEHRGGQGNPLDAPALQGDRWSLGGVVVGTDVAVFRRINYWPGWLYPPMWTVQLSGVIGALPVVAAAAALRRRLRLAAALVAATVLKVSLESVAKMFVQRDRPAETLRDVILRGKAAAHGLSFPSGHAMVIFAIAALVAPDFKSWWKVLPWALAAAVCLSRVYLGAHFPLDVAAGAGLGLLIGGVLNLVFGVPSNSPSTAHTNRLP